MHSFKIIRITREGLFFINNSLRDNQLRMLWSSRIDYATNSGVKSHVHSNFHQLLILISGGGTIQVGDENFPISSNQYIFFPQTVEHGFHFSEDTATLDFKFHIPCKELEEHIICSNMVEPANISNLDQFKQVFKLSIAYQKTNDMLLRYRIDVGFKASFLFLLHAHQSLKNKQSLPDVTSEMISDSVIVQFLREHIHTKITLEEIAQHFRFHPHYFIDMCHKELGTTPMHYLQHLRLEKAKEYLEFTNMSIDEIAGALSLSTPYFSRLFREREGLPPSQYREQTRTLVDKDIIMEQDFSIEMQPKRKNTLLFNQNSLL